MDDITTIDLARAALKRGKSWLQGAERALEDERWDDAVYASQMAVEHSTKGLLMAFGIDYPKVHDVSPIFKRLASKKLPSWFSSKIEELAENISELAKLRAIAGYGYERGIDVSYFKEYASEAYEKAKKHYKACAKLLREAFDTTI